MITIVSILASLYFIVGIVGIIHIYHTNNKVYKQIKHNQYHMDRANEYFEAYTQTGDCSYLEYATEELKKVQY